MPPRKPAQPPAAAPRARKSAAANDTRASREQATSLQLSSDLADPLRTLAANDRVTVRRDGPPSPAGKCVVYWMQRAQRGRDNHALDLAVTVANHLRLPVVAYFAGVANYPNANLRHFAFLNEGLRTAARDLAARQIGFVLRVSPDEDVPRFARDVNAAMVIGDENPLRFPELWRQRVAAALTVPFWTVDTDLIVPARLFGKTQYAAYTMRPRLWKLLPDYLDPHENLTAAHPWHKPRGLASTDPAADMTAGWTHLDRSISPIALPAGSDAAEARLQHFIQHVLPVYAEQRNKPDLDGTSRLSPYLHYGHISPLRIYLAVREAAAADPRLRENADSYFNELITWRELSANFVKYDPHYDSPETAEPWARTTVAAHALDPRNPLYTVEQMEQAQTYDELWNAAQRQMLREGWMHNFMRMYWAKKILEWSPDNATALQTSIYLNDKYFLDGRDPGGYAGIAWAIYGKFDRPWGERPIFGKIRYMSGASSGRKFNSRAYIARYSA